MPSSIATALPRLLVPAAIAASLLAGAPAAHAEADGSPHAWLTVGTPLREATTVWVRQEGSEDAAPITVTTTIKVGTTTIATLPAVTSPAVSIFDSVPVTITVPAATITAARQAATKAKVTDAQVTFRASATYAEGGRATNLNTTIAMPVVPGVRVGHERTGGVRFTTGTWLRVARTTSGVAKFAPVSAGAGCSMVVSSRVNTAGQNRVPISDLRARLGNAKLVERGTTPLPYVIGSLEGGVPRLVNGMADNAPPIIRALAAVRVGDHTRILNLEARPDASCKASKAQTNAAVASLKRAVTSARAS